MQPPPALRFPLNLPGTLGHCHLSVPPSPLVLRLPRLCGPQAGPCPPLQPHCVHPWLPRCGFSDRELWSWRGSLPRLCPHCPFCLECCTHSASPVTSPAPTHLLRSTSHLPLLGPTELLQAGSAPSTRVPRIPCALSKHLPGPALTLVTCLCAPHAGNGQPGPSYARQESFVNEHLEAADLGLNPALFFLFVSFNCVTLGKLFNLCKPQFLRLLDRNNNHPPITELLGK